MHSLLKANREGKYNARPAKTRNDRVRSSYHIRRLHDSDRPPIPFPFPTPNQAAVLSPYDQRLRHLSKNQEIHIIKRTDGNYPQ